MSDWRSEFTKTKNPEEEELKRKVGELEERIKEIGKSGHVEPPIGVPEGGAFWDTAPIVEMLKPGVYWEYRKQRLTVLSISNSIIELEYQDDIGDPSKIHYMYVDRNGSCYTNLEGDIYFRHKISRSELNISDHVIDYWINPRKLMVGGEAHRDFYVQSVEEVMGRRLFRLVRNKNFPQVKKSHDAKSGLDFATQMEEWYDEKTGLLFKETCSDGSIRELTYTSIAI
jgi:hypothetical protein